MVRRAVEKRRINPWFKPMALGVLDQFRLIRSHLVGYGFRVVARGDLDLPGAQLRNTTDRGDVVALFELLDRNSGQ